MADPRAALAESHRGARVLVAKVGGDRTKKILRRAQRELEERLRTATGLAGPGEDSFTAVQLRATLAHVRAATRYVQKGIRDSLLEAGDEAAAQAATGTVRYLTDAEKRFKGVGRPLALDEASIIDEASSGVRASILRRLDSSGEPIEGADEEPHPAKQGILERYGLQTVGHFEEILQKSFVARTPWADVRDQLTEASPFLQGAPAHWAERIVRTESMSVYNRAGWESVREADAQLGDMLKILSATFDDRTAADSYAVHGQIRRPEEAFQSWFGLYQHPPNRPNDREVVVPHRMSWPIPDYLAWKTDGEVAARWRFEGRKGRPPPRPKMTTVPLDQIGKGEESPPKGAQVQVPERIAEPAFDIARHVKKLQIEPRENVDGDVYESLRQITHPSVIRFLDDAPLTAFVTRARTHVPGGGGEAAYGTYWNGVIEIAAKSDRKVFDRSYAPAKYWSAEDTVRKPNGFLDTNGSWTTTTGARSFQDALDATVIHELGHHVHLHGAGPEGNESLWDKPEQKEAAQRARAQFKEVDDIVADAYDRRQANKNPPISRYATTNHKEYFAENFAAYHKHKDLLEKHDPTGYRMVERVLKIRGEGLTPKKG